MLYKMYDQDIDGCYKNIMELKAATKQDPKDKKLKISSIENLVNVFVN